MKKNLILFVPLISKTEFVEFENEFYFERIIDALKDSIRPYDSIRNKQYVFSIYNREKFDYFVPHYSKELLRNLKYEFRHRLFYTQPYYYEIEIDFNTLVNSILELKENEKFDQIYCFTFTPTKNIFRELRPYLFFEGSSIIYRNIDLINASLLSKPPSSILEEKDLFYNIPVISDLDKLYELFKDKKTYFVSKLFSSVYLGASLPKNISQNHEFTIYFSAYIEEFRDDIEKIIKRESVESAFKADLYKCVWTVGTQVDVVCYADGLKITDPKQTFKWTGEYNLLKFDSVVDESYKRGSVLVKIDIFIEGIRIAKLRPEIIITHLITEELNTIEIASPKTAFASYARSDRPEVLPRVRSLEIRTSMDIFLDCLSIKPGDRWKDKIAREITNRDIFLLFWSKAAQKSVWVSWEWKKALSVKGIDFIEPHPLVTNNTCPLPGELSELQGSGIMEEIISHDKFSVGNFGNLKRLCYWVKRIVYSEV